MPSSSDHLATRPTDEVPGWAMAPCDAASAGFVARGSWLLEPDTGTGMLLYPRDWSFAERRDVTTHLRDRGWSVVPISRFLHLTSDGSTAIRLLTQITDTDTQAGGEADIVTLPQSADDRLSPTDEVFEASV